MLKKFVNGLDRVIQKYTPDPFVIAILLTLIAAVCSFLFFDVHRAADNTQSSVHLWNNARILQSLAHAWGTGFWKLMTFTLQMVMILLCGYILAKSRPVEWALKQLVQLIQTPTTAILATTFLACLASWVNWGFGLVVGAIFAVEVAKHMPHCNFRIIVASAYSGFVVWHGGLSGSIPLTLNTPGIAEKWVTATIPMSQTIFSPFNITATLVVIACLMITNFLLLKTSEDSFQDLSNLAKSSSPPKVHTRDSFADFLETTPGVPISIVGLALIYLGVLYHSDQLRLDLNMINFCFLFLGLLLHWRTRNFLEAAREGSGKVSSIIIQYPFYAGIMALLENSGLGSKLASGLTAIATETTFPLFTFYSAGVLNFFVPSGGGQWALQAPVVIPGIAELGADLTKSIMAVAWGDAWTNLAQPFWALPLLAIVGMKIRDILGFCLIHLFVTGVALSLLFLFF